MEALHTHKGVFSYFYLKDLYSFSTIERGNLRPSEKLWNFTNLNPCTGDNWPSFPPTHCWRWCCPTGPWSKSMFRFPHWSRWLCDLLHLFLLPRSVSQSAAVKLDSREVAHFPKTRLDGSGCFHLGREQGKRKDKDKWRGKEEGNASITQQLTGLSL